MLSASIPSWSASPIAFSSTRSFVSGFLVRDLVVMGLDKAYAVRLAYTISLRSREEVMQAIVRRRWGRAGDVVELVDLTTPEPAADEVVVRVLASSINRGDYYALGGAAVLMRPMIGGFLRPKTERIGGDFAGVAEAVGGDVTDIQPGDEVYGCRSGAFAQYVAVKQAVASKPANLSFEEAAAVPVAALTALEALRDHGALKPGQRV